MFITTRILLAFAGALALSGPVMSATIVWQGGSGSFSSANWTVDAVANQTHPSFGSGVNDLVIHNTTINGGSVTSFNNAGVGAIGNSDSLLVTGGASISGDFLEAGQSHTNDITLVSGSMTFSNVNAFRSPNAPFTGIINFTGLAGSAFVAQTNNATVGSALAAKISSGTGNAFSFFSIDGTMVASGVNYDGTNLSAVNTALALTGNRVNGRWFQIEESSGIQTLTLIPEPSAFALFGFSALLLLRRRR